MLKTLYKKLLKPILFLFPADTVHHWFLWMGEKMGQKNFVRNFFALIFSHHHPVLETEVEGIKFQNPVGLSAGYDYNGSILKFVPSLGFGFTTVGTITFLPSKGNEGNHYERLPKSKAILVNKGFATEGAEIIAKRLTDPILEKITFGVSVGSSNVPEIATIDLAIEDYLKTFEIIEKTPYHKYYELNISCPNTCLTESFLKKENFERLLHKVKNLNLSRPVFIKMPNEMETREMEDLVEAAVKEGFKTFIFSNLKKKREGVLEPKEFEKIKDLKGNLSGAPCFEGSNFWIKHFREKYGEKIHIIGVGGIFSPSDAQKKLFLGAELVQLITGLIYEGPHLVKDIKNHLVEIRTKN